MPLARVVPGPKKTAPDKRVDQRTPVARLSVRAKRELPSRAMRREGCSDARLGVPLASFLLQPRNCPRHELRMRDLRISHVHHPDWPRLLNSGPSGAASGCIPDSHC